MPGQSARSTGRSKRRSAGEWVLRAGLATAAVVAASVTAVQSFAYATRSEAPERAYRIAPWDGRIAAALSTKETSVAEPNAAQLADAVRHATEARVTEPLAVSAIASLGIASQFDGDAAVPRRMFAYSNRLSRRDLRTRLWAIEDAVAREDIPDALRNYDIALRTSRRAPEMLFPILSGAIGDPSIAQGMVDLLATKPPWGESFVAQLADSDLPATTIEQFYRRASAKGIFIAPSAEAAVVDSLIRSGAYGQAWAYYRRIRQGVDPRRSRNPDFADTVESPSPFDWRVTADQPGVSASLQLIDGSGIFDFSAPSTVGATVLHQFQLLPPGRYRLEGISIGVEQTLSARPYWSLACIDGRELNRIDLPNSSEAGGRFAGEFQVDNACPVQMLRFHLRPSNKIGGVVGQIERTALNPA